MATGIDRLSLENWTLIYLFLGSIGCRGLASVYHNIRSEQLGFTGLVVCFNYCCFDC